jgi:hypothetical protein
MSDEIRTAVDLRTSIVDQRGGIECFDGPQRRLLDALVFELAKKPNEIDVRVVTDLMAMLPRAVSAPGCDDRAGTEAAIAPLLRLFRHLHESVHTLSAENARLKAQLAGGLPGALAGHSTDEANSTPRGLLDGGTGVLTPPTADIVPPGERAECDAGPRAGPDDPPPRSTRIINAKAVKRPNPPAASWDDTPNGRAWQDWHDAQQGGVHYDRWGNHNV